MAPLNRVKEDVDTQDQATIDFNEYRLQWGKFFANPPEGEEIVVTGLAGQYPDSDHVYHFRDNLYNKVDMVTEDTRRWEHTHPEIPKRGGKLNRIQKFDPGFFGVHIKQAESMCPMVRLHLERAIEAIFDAGLHPSDLEGANCGVFVGACISETERRWFCDNLKSKYHAVTGCTRSMITNRVSYFLKLKGPSFITDSACSSSLYGLEQAYKMMRLGQIDCAIVGGASCCLHPYVSLQFARLGVLSMDGACKSFDAEGSGYARSEAASSIFLQRAKDAKRIYCQIVHAKTNCDGYKPQGITYPSGEAQRQLLSEFYEECNVNPADLTFLEAHGTGTKVGDPEECVAIDEVFCKERTTPLRIGSVKSNIGHSEAGAGLCSFTKVVIAMEHGVIPPNLHYKKPREGVEPLERGRLKVVAEKTPFECDKNVLIGINSFGFGGGNCHILTRWNEKAKINEGVPRDNIPRLICVSGRTKEAVDSLLDSTISKKLDAEHVRLLHNIFRKNIDGHQFRGYSIISKDGEITRNSEYFSEDQEMLYFVFGGVDNAWYSIGEQLFNIPVFAASIQKIHDILEKKNINITEIILNSKKNTSLANNILGNMAVQIGITDILKAIELKPNKIIGYSLGELICAYSDDILTLEEVVLSTLIIYNAVKSICQPLVQYVIKLSENQLKQIIPANVEITGIISEREVLVSGVEGPLAAFVKSLKQYGVIVEDISTTNTCFLMEDFEKIETHLVQELIKVIPKPKKRSEKWVSSTGSDSIFAESFVKSLTNPINFNNLIKDISMRSGIFEVGSGIFSKISGGYLEKKKVKTVYLKPNKNIDGESGLLEALGSIYNYGYNFQIDKIYPKVEFPVSRGTTMISPYIRWDHDKDWEVFSYRSQLNIRTGSRVVLVGTSINQYKFIDDHVIDGRAILPASCYLNIVWDTLALVNSRMTGDLVVVFENVKFLRATPVKDIPTEFFVMIQRGSGNFEIIEGDTPIVTGRISLLGRESNRTELPIFNLNDDSIKMSAKDIYKELRLRGYNYKGDFKGVVETNLAANTGLIKWDDNWITFLDSMFQMKILNVDSRTLYVPTSISKLVIDGKQQSAYGVDKVNIPVYYHHDCNIITAGGVEVRGLQARPIPRRKQRGKPVLEKFLFVPNHDTLSCPQSVRVNVQICLENIVGFKVKVVEVIDESTKEDSEPLAPLVFDALGDMPLIQPTIRVLSKKEMTIPNVTVEDAKLIAETDSWIVIGTHLLKKTQMLHIAFGALEKDGFVISREDIDFTAQSVNTRGIDIITVHKTEKESLVMVRKSIPCESPVAVDVSDPKYEFAWLPELQAAVKDDTNVVVYAQNQQTNGVVGLVNCLRREPGGSKVKCVHIVDSNAPKFDVSSPFYAEQVNKNLATNVLKDGKWGTYRHVLLENINEVESEHCYVNSLTRGDLSSLKWIQGPLSFSKSDLPMEKELVCVYYSSLNFRDVMIASGRLSADLITMDRREQECVQGLEFSGRTLSGRRVMGMVIKKALATLLVADSYLLYDIPDEWTLEEAATVPVVYSTVLFALVDAGGIKRGDTVLIHSGAGGVGQAAISTALFHGCRVYTTVGTPEKREFLKKRYPQLKDNHIGNSHDTSFEQMIYAETDGRGVDIVLNSLAEDKLMASVRCLARRGRFVEIGKFDLAQNTNFRLALLEKDCSFHSVMLDTVLASTPTMKLHLQQLLTTGIASGAVRPLSSHVFKSNEVEQAFRFMAKGKHMGKVIVNVRKEEPQKTCPPKSLIMKCIPRYLCSDEKTYVICGGLGGFGLELADWLIIRGARTVLLSSRNGIKNGYQASRIRLWKSYGVNVRISTADVTTRSGCEELLKEANKMGPVEAIFNLAVILKDALFTNQSVENFQVSFGPKANATRHLDEVSRRLCPQLKDFVIFSSISCGLGNPGQTNYGMANSVMERICEKRQQDGLPALAIEWGAVGDVGLVAEMQEVHRELEIGGTLQQRISSCLDVLDNFLKQKNAIVSSMVVAEKRAGGADNVVDAVANILGLTDLKTVSMHATLAELGMDSMTAVEIKQTLEREYEVFLTAQDIRSMTFSRLKDIEAERENEGRSTDKKAEKVPQGFELILRLMGEEASTNIPIVRIPSRVKEGTEAPKIFLLSGVEGVANALAALTKNLNYHALGVQFCHDTPEDTIQDTAMSRFPHILPYLKKNEPFTMVSYSFGTVIALELVALLEQRGHVGTLFIIDGSPKMLLELMRQQLITDSEDQFQTSLLCALMALYMPFETILQNREKIFRANGFEARMKAAYECTPKDSPYSKEYLRITAIGLYKRLKGLAKYIPTFAKFKSTVKLFKPKRPTVLDLPEDYYMSQYCEKPVEVKVFEGNHITILNNTELADAINSEAVVSPVFIKESIIENGAGKINMERVEVKQI